MQTAGLKRDHIDKFYTNPNIAKKIIDKVSKLYDFNIFDKIIEPSAGDGSFSDILKINNNNKLIALDIKPGNKYIKKIDFFDFKLKNYDNKLLVIGNPPFGHKGSYALKFINKAFKLTNSFLVIAFILPKSMKKVSFKKSIPLNLHLIKECDLPINSFLLNGKEYNVPTILQIWEKKDNERKIIKIPIPKNFKFVKKNESPDFSIRRVGHKSGELCEDIDNKNINTHYFINVNNKEDFKKKYLNIKFKILNYTVGVKSLSKYELIKEINKLK